MTSQSTSWARKYGPFIAITSFFALLYYLGGLLVPFLVSAFIAWVLNKPVSALEKWHLPRSLGSAIMILLAFGTLTIFLLFLIPFLVGELSKLAGLLPAYTDNILNWVAHLSTLIPGDFILDEKLKDLASRHLGTALSWITHFLADLLMQGVAVVNLITLLILTPLISFYFVNDWDEIKKKVRSFFPRRNLKTYDTLTQDVSHILGVFLKGQGLLVLVLMVLYSTGLWLIDLENAIILGLLTGLLSFIPYVGFIIGFSISASLSILQFETWGPFFAVLGLFISIQLIESFFLSVQMVGRKVGLHPAWGLFSLLAGGSLFGFLGLLLAFPGAAVLKVLLVHGVKAYEKSDFYRSKA
ncbi:MAG: AI-2E family transporter [bacterium]|nr:AI-2E family transporter [bacterium]